MSVSGVSNSNNYDNQYQSNEAQQNTEQAQTNSAGEAASASSTSSTDDSNSAGETDSANETSDTSETSKAEKARRYEEGGELLEGKSTQRGDTDYFTGKSVVTDPDTVIAIAKIMDSHHASDVVPERMAQWLREEGYNVQVVQVDGRKAVRFENGDYFYDSDGDGCVGTKDVNMQLALTMVEDQFGIDLSSLKNSKYTALHGKIGSRTDGVGDPADPLTHWSAVTGDGENAALDPNSLANDLKDDAATKEEVSSETEAILEDLNNELEAAGYRGERTAYELWADGELSNVLFQYGIDEPSLPDSNDKAFEKAMAVFGAAMSIAAANELA